MPSNVAEMLSHPIEGEVQDIGHITEQEVIEIEWKRWDHFQHLNPGLWQRKGGEGVHKSCLTLPTDWWEFQKFGGRSATYEKMSVGYSSHRYAHTAYDQSNHRREGVIYVWAMIWNRRT